MISYELIATVTGMFLVTATGFVSKKLKMFEENFTKQLSLLILHIAQPCLLLSSMLKLPYDKENV